MNPRFISLAPLTLALLLPALTALGAESEESSWFVVRDPQSGDCWSAKLITINGQLASGKNRAAGGPFPGKEEAEARLARLVERGICRED